MGSEGDAMILLSLPAPMFLGQHIYRGPKR